jgi:hypothetical protein
MTKQSQPRKGHALTPEQVMEIYTRAKSGESCPAIARDYPVGDSTVRQIRDGLLWGSLTGQARKPPGQARKVLRGAQHGRAGSDEKTVKEIYRRAWAGEHVNDLATEFGRKASIISRIKYGVLWSSVTGHVGGGPGRFATAKLKPQRVKQIYQRAWSGRETVRAIAASEGLPPGTITNIKHGRIWTSVTGHTPKRQALQDGLDGLDA